MRARAYLTALSLGLLASAALPSAGQAAPRLVLPAPTLRTGQAYSPHAIVAKLAQKRFKVSELYRKGQAYAVVALGPSGNTVQMTIDGASGTIVGMAVIRWAHPHHAGAPRPPAGRTPSIVRPARPNLPVRTADSATPPAHAPSAATPPVHTPPASPRPPAGHNGPPSHAPDSTPFGAVIPFAAFHNWTPYREADWRRPGELTIAVTPSYAPYREALPYNYYVVMPDRDAVPIAPPDYNGYDVYDPQGEALNNALDAADDAEWRAALEADRANYEAVRADAAESDNAALSAENEDLRNQLDAIQNEPPPDSPLPPDNPELAIAPEPGENLDTIPDVPPPTDLGDDTAPAEPPGDTSAPPADNGSGENNPPAGNSSSDNNAPPADNGSGENNPPAGNNASDNNAPPADNGSGENNPPAGNNAGENNAPPADNGSGENNPPAGNNAGENNAPPADNGSGENNPPAGNNAGENNEPPADNGSGENNPPTGNNAGENSEPPADNGSGENNPPAGNNAGENNEPPADNGSGENNPPAGDNNDDQGH